MADLTLAVAQSHQEAPHQTGASRRAPKRRLKSYQKARERQLIAKFDPNQPRDPKGTSTGGQFASAGARTFTSEEGYQWHEQGPVLDWAKALPYRDSQALTSYASFGYHGVNDLRRGTFVPATVAHFVRAATKEEYEASKFQITDEYIAQHGHPFGKEPYQRKPEDPFERVLDAEGQYVGHIQHNVFYTNPAGEKVEYSVQRAGPDTARLHEVQQEADQLDAIIAQRGYVLPEAITVGRGAYLPGVTVSQLQHMVYDETLWEEKGFTSTMVGPAERRAESYPALGKWESIYNRYPNQPIAAHQDEVGTAVRFHITLPKGTKVAPIEALRRLDYEFPRIPDPSPRPADVKEEYWTMRDLTAPPTVGTQRLEDKSTRTESELVLGSGAKFRVMKVRPGYKYPTGDATLKPVHVVEVDLEYIGGGSSEGVKR